jgi:DNA-binding Lrp family transcriptional regulator
LTLSAFVLIDCDFPFLENIIKELKKIPEIEEFYRVQSIYDIIAKVNADSEHQLNEVVMRKVRQTEGVKNTLTMIIISKDPKETEKESRYSYLNLFIIT